MNEARRDAVALAIAALDRDDMRFDAIVSGAGMLSAHDAFERACLLLAASTGLLAAGFGRDGLEQLALRMAAES